jgi:hypothetical protein
MPVTKASLRVEVEAATVVDVMGRRSRSKKETAVLERLSTLEITDEEARTYSGKWVSTRAGHVIAAADSYEELMDDPNRERLDGALFVSPVANNYL